MIQATVDKIVVQVEQFRQPSVRRITGSPDWMVQPPKTRGGEQADTGKMYLNHPDGWQVNVKGTPREPLKMQVIWNPNKHNHDTICSYIEETGWGIPVGLDGKVFRVDIERQQETNHPIQVYRGYLQSGLNRRFTMQAGEHYSTPSYTCTNSGKRRHVQCQMYDKSAEQGETGNLLRLEARLMSGSGCRRFGLNTYSDLGNIDIDSTYVKVLNMVFPRIGNVGNNYKMHEHIQLLTRLADKRNGLSVFMWNFGGVHIGDEYMYRLLKAAPIDRQKRYRWLKQYEQMKRDIAGIMQAQPDEPYHELLRYWAA
jgi:hypothetical protein